MLTKIRTRSHISMIAMVMVSQAIVVALATMILHVATAAAERFFSIHFYY